MVLVRSARTRCGWRSSPVPARPASRWRTSKTPPGHADPRTTRCYDRGRHSLDRHASYAVTAWLDGSEHNGL